MYVSAIFQHQIQDRISLKCKWPSRIVWNSISPHLLDSAFHQAATDRNPGVKLSFTNNSMTAAKFFILKSGIVGEILRATTNNHWRYFRYPHSTCPSLNG